MINRIAAGTSCLALFRKSTHEHVAEHGGDPKRLFVMGHSAGAQLAALICTDDRHLKAEGLSLGIIKGCVPVDGDTYDVPAMIEKAETSERDHQSDRPMQVTL